MDESESESEGEGEDESESEGRGRNSLAATSIRARARTRTAPFEVEWNGATWRLRMATDIYIRRVAESARNRHEEDHSHEPRRTLRVP